MMHTAGSQLWAQLMVSGQNEGCAAQRGRYIAVDYYLVFYADIQALWPLHERRPVLASISNCGSIYHRKQLIDVLCKQPKKGILVVLTQNSQGLQGKPFTNAQAAPQVLKSETAMRLGNCIWDTTLYCSKGLLQACTAPFALSISTCKGTCRWGKRPCIRSSLLTAWSVAMPLPRTGLSFTVQHT